MKALFQQAFIEAELIGDPVNEKHTFEVVHLVLDAAGQEAISLDPLGAAHLVAIADLNRGRTHHIQVNARDAEAAFLISLDCSTEAGDLGIDQNHRRRGGILGIKIDHQ